MQVPDWYYKCSRIIMLSYIPKSAKRVLDIGCGEGNFAEIIKKELKAEVWGVELNSSAASKALEKIDNVLIGDITNLIENIKKKYFDCLVFNDILEHLTDPYFILEKAKELLTEKGIIVLSVPNVLYVSNLYRLIVLKDWRYIDHGVLDISHYRFFTKKSLKNMLEDLGYEIVYLNGINPYKSILFEILNYLTIGHFKDSKYLQFACVAKPKVYSNK